MYKLSKIYSLLTMPLPLTCHTLPFSIFPPQIMFPVSQISVPVCQANTKIPCLQHNSGWHPNFDFNYYSYVNNLIKNKCLLKISDRWGQKMVKKERWHWFCKKLAGVHKNLLKVNLNCHILNFIKINPVVLKCISNIIYIHGDRWFNKYIFILHTYNKS